MKILVHSSFDTVSIRDGLGKPEYSYHFVLMGFLPALALLGTVVRVSDPTAEVDAIHDACLAEGQNCVFLCFAPAHLVPITLRCPTIPVIAWEFSSMPCEMWGEDPRSDWRVVFRHCGRAITLSHHTAALVKEVMGPDYPVFPIPVAVYDAFASLFQLVGTREPRWIRFRGELFDSRADLPPPIATPDPPAIAPAKPPPEAPPAVLELPPRRRDARERLSLTLGYALAWYRDVWRDLLPDPLKTGISAIGRTGYRSYRFLRPPPPPPAVPTPTVVEPPAEPQPPEMSVLLEDIVYTAVLSPKDGRKNWHDLLTSFLWAFQDERRATLVLKMPFSAHAIMHAAFENVLDRFAPFACRVVLIYGFLEDAEYATLVTASDFYVNASHCEGLCIPLMEFLSAGVPAIAPDHTAMADYITPRLGFVLSGSLEHNVWPFDPRDIFTTMRYRMEWDSLETAFRSSFAAGLSRQGGYAAMARAAHDAMRAYCSVERVQSLLAEALNGLAPALGREAAE